VYNPEFHTNQNGVPIISGADLDIIGERLVFDFSPDLMCAPREIDIDRFVINYLGMKQDFFYLSHCGVYLGMTVFLDSNTIPVYIPELNQAEYASAKARTVIIDQSLMEDDQEHRYRFTMGHEGSHGILHTPYFLSDVGRGIPYSQEYSKFIRCRADNYRFDIHSPSTRWTDAKRIEWQANRLSSAILMPKCMVSMLMAQMPNRGEVDRTRSISENVSEVFNVSLEAAFYRLKDLGYLDKDLGFQDVFS
jgi:hypothetical protein